MIQDQVKKYVRYSVAGKEFHMYINTYIVVITTKDTTVSQFRSTQIYVESYDNDFLVKVCLDHTKQILELDRIQYAPKCDLTTYFFDHKDLLLFQYLAAILQLVRAEFPDLRVAEMRDELTFRVSETSRRYAYLYVSFFIAALNNGESWFERYFKAEPVQTEWADSQCTLEARARIFTTKPDLGGIVCHTACIDDFDAYAFLEAYAPMYETMPDLRSLIRRFANRKDFNTLTYWYPPYARWTYRIPSRFCLDLSKIPGGGPYYTIYEVSTTPLIARMWTEWRFYSDKDFDGSDESITIQNDGLSTMQLSLADVED